MLGISVSYMLMSCCMHTYIVLSGNVLFCVFVLCCRNSIDSEDDDVVSKVPAPEIKAASKKGKHRK